MFKRPTVDSILATFTHAINTLDALIVERKGHYDAKAELINRLDEGMTLDAQEVSRALKIRNALNDLIV